MILKHHAGMSLSKVDIHPSDLPQTGNALRLPLSRA
jgi:hypothetical protein